MARTWVHPSALSERISITLKAIPRDLSTLGYSKPCLSCRQSSGNRGRATSHRE